MLLSWLFLFLLLSHCCVYRGVFCATVMGDCDFDDEVVFFGNTFSSVLPGSP